MEWWHRLAQLFDRKKHDYSKLQEKWNQPSKKSTSKTNGSYLCPNGIASNHITLSHNTGDNANGHLGDKAGKKSVLMMVLSVIYIPVWRLLHWFCLKPELCSLSFVFLYFLNVGYLRFVPHLSDIRNMRVPWKEQLHWFLLNAGWRDPIDNIYDMSQLHPYSAVIAGMVKDSEDSLPTLLRQLDILACSFDYTHFFVLESNSHDRTRDIIHDWSMKPVDCKDIANDLSKNKSHFKAQYLDTPLQTFLYDYRDNERQNMDFEQSLWNDLLPPYGDTRNDNPNGQNTPNNGGKKASPENKSRFRQRLNEREELLQEHHKTHHFNRHKYGDSETDTEQDKLSNSAAKYAAHKNKQSKRNVDLINVNLGSYASRNSKDGKQNDDNSADRYSNVKRANAQLFDDTFKLDKNRRNARKRAQAIQDGKSNTGDGDDTGEEDHSTINIIRLNVDARIEKTAFQPMNEFPEILELMKRHKTGDSYQIREERYVIYRNFILDHIKSWYREYKTKTGETIDYLFWIDMDLRGFDMQGIASEFPIAFRSGYDVVCANGMKYTGWYYDSYATIYQDDTWAHGVPRYAITNEVRTSPTGIYDVKSCFGGLAAYHLDFLLQSECRYEHFGWAYAKVPEFATFADQHMLHKSCEHLPINLCLRQNGGKLGVSTHAHALYGTFDEHG